MKLRLLALVALAVLAALAPSAAACTVEPPENCTSPAPGVEVCSQPACPPNPGHLTVRAAGVTVRVPIPG